MIETDIAPTLKLTPGRYAGLPASARLAAFAALDGPALLLTTNLERAELFRSGFAFGAPTVINPGLGDWAERGDKVVLTLEQALRPFPADPENHALHLEQGRDYPREQLLARLLHLGFERDGAPGFDVRGDTIILRLTEDPADELRLGFFGDELETLQRPDRAVRGWHLGPLEGSEAQDGQEAWTTRLIEHLPGTVFLDVPELFAGELGEQGSEWLFNWLASRTVISFGRDPLALEDRSAGLRPLGHYRGRLSEFRLAAEQWLAQGYSVTVLLNFERTGRFLQEKTLEGVPTRWVAEVPGPAGELSLLLAPGTQGGYVDSAARQVVLSEELLYGSQGGRKLRRLAGRGVHDATQLSVGDYLIHPDHGVGMFQGLEPRQVVGVTRDYLIIRYAGDGKLYLPVELLPLLRRHPGTTDDPPRLSTLGTNEWARARERARANAQEMAGRLLRTYAERQVTEGVALPALPDWDPLITAGFPFELTVDQARAVEATLADMSRSVPMDRLISGDVGFGKTEVAIRAAHRAVGHSKQTVMLVPTTVLAKQHYETLAERFSELPVTVRMLSRFQTDREARETLAGLADGSVDIVIGTQRLLGEGITFKDLGLLVIDEEHRFGVVQKERLKSLKANVDVLSLSATPIPRTLYMSLIGLRDVSQIMTPPAGRKPIQTILQPYDALAVRNAIMAELEQGGKTFYIYDRVGSMGMRARTLQQLVPEARIGVAHGQMDTRDLEEVMLNFEQGAYDVLLATTIVESGLDITGANTLVIERADRLGLAQLYQLRGRVGRRQTEAYAYLFYPGRLTEDAQRRLYAIAELNDLGSGHLLAEKDMEIRGVGNLLGPEQHGQINAVSLAVYTEMLAEEIAKLKGQEQAEAKPPVAIDLNLDARLSPAYIQDDAARIALYGRLAETGSLAEVGRINRELRAAYGPLPAEVQAFIELVKLRLLAAAKGVVSIKEHMTDIEITFATEKVDYDVRAIREFPFSAEPTRYPPGFSIRKRGLRAADYPAVISRVLYACG
jgi:transcription-repair coupling factor (superfamily II helicase)